MYMHVILGFMHFFCVIYMKFVPLRKSNQQFTHSMELTNHPRTTSACTNKIFNVMGDCVI